MSDIEKLKLGLRFKSISLFFVGALIMTFGWVLSNAFRLESFARASAEGWWLFLVITGIAALFYLDLCIKFAQAQRGYMVFFRSIGRFGGGEFSYSTVSASDPWDPASPSFKGINYPN